ncbi:hypothetical protein WN55_02622 [Dufourea novaeangliae]|uniref:Uncharacterized protein n=1 Tax=Dufourea novaeangliae TaxID=178035 RepID=A0A154PJJ6_DUFNO|nr:hypothetical protein WN55_02622 [Dufourea novaeangliae]
MSHTLPNSFSTSSYELYAILMTLKHIKTSNDKFIIHTIRIDVSTALTSNNDNPLVKEELETLYGIENENRTIEILFDKTSTTPKNTETGNIKSITTTLKQSSKTKLKQRGI